jgi:hypothetical protein
MRNNITLLPPVKRARGFRLYAGERRFVDLYQDGGRAVLGHNPPNVLREMKNAAERSLFAPYPSFYPGRFQKALALLFPGRSFIAYGSLEAVPFALRDKTPVWRPFMEADRDELLAVLPHPLAPVVLAKGKGMGGVAGGVAPAEGVGQARLAAGGDFPLPLSPVILALATRAIHDLLDKPERGKVVFQRVEEVLSGGLWKREGIYLSFREKTGEAAWERIFTRFLDAGFLIPPDPRDPLILPGELSPGEEEKLARCLLNPAG